MKRAAKIGKLVLACALLAGGPLGQACARRPAPAETLKVVFFTDVHARVEWGTPDALALAAAAITAERADVVIGGGDLITDGWTSSAAQAAPRWEAYWAMHAAIRPAPVCAVGNHDLVGVEPTDGSAPAADPRAEVRARLGVEQTYRSLDRAGYHFILLDAIEPTSDELKYVGRVGPEQMRWLKADLARVARGTPIVVATHVPLVTEFYERTVGPGAVVPPNRGVVNHAEVLAAFEGHRLLAVLQGHLHVNEVLRRGETTFITGGAVSGKWWRGAWHGTPEGYGVLRLHPDRVEWEYRTYGWTARRPDGQ